MIQPRVGWRGCDEEERRASLLGISFEFSLGLDGRATLFDHSWDDGPLTEFNHFWQAIAWLRRHGHLDDRGQPTALAGGQARARRGR